MLGNVDFFEKSNRRMRSLVDNRAIAYKMLRKYTNLSLSEIGALFKKDHATILHGIKLCDNLIQTDKEFRNKKVVPIINKLNEILPCLDEDEIIPNPYEEIKELREKNYKLLNLNISIRGQLLHVQEIITLLPTVHKKRFKNVRFVYNSEQENSELEMVQE